MKLLHLAALFVSISLFVVSDLAGASDATLKTPSTPHTDSAKAVQGGPLTNADVVEDRGLIPSWLYEWFITLFKSKDKIKFDKDLEGVTTIDEAFTLANVKELAQLKNPNDNHVKHATSFFNNYMLKAIYKKFSAADKEKVGFLMYEALKQHLGLHRTVQWMELGQKKGSKLSKEMASEMQKAYFKDMYQRHFKPAFESFAKESFDVELATHPEFFTAGTSKNEMSLDARITGKFIDKMKGEVVGEAPQAHSHHHHHHHGAKHSHAH